MHAPFHRPHVAVALGAAVVLAAGCTDTAEEAAGPTSTPSPPAAAATPSPTPTTPATPTPTPSATTPSPSGPPVDDDGCPPPHDARASLPAVATTVPTRGAPQRITRSPGGRTVDVTVVTLEGGTGPDVTATLRGAVDELLADFDEAATDMPGAAADPELRIEVTLTRLDERFVAAALEGYQYTGGASGNALVDGWTFASATGQQLALADVGLGGACTDELGALLADALRARDVGLYEEADEALRAGGVDLGPWTLHEDTLAVHFAPYEVAPGVAGAVTGRVPLSELRSATGTPLGTG